MMTALNSDAQSKGGRERDKGRDPWEAKFMGVVAGSSRPLKKDHPAASDAKEAVNVLKTEAARFPWVFLTLVGRDGRTVRSTLPESEAIARVNQTGGAIGLAGYLFLRDRQTVFVRPFISGMDVEKKLRAVIEKQWEQAQAFLRDNADHMEETSSPVSAKVYTDGKQGSIFYSWEPQRTPDPTWELAGVLYVARSGNAWVAKARAVSEKWQGLMSDVLPMFTGKIKEVLPLLNELGLSLTNLKPGLEKSLKNVLRKME